MKYFIKYFFRRCEQMSSIMHIYLYLLKTQQKDFELAACFNRNSVQPYDAQLHAI